jgi:hypothetical protein
MYVARSNDCMQGTASDKTRSVVWPRCCAVVSKSDEPRLCLFAGPTSASNPLSGVCVASRPTLHTYYCGSNNSCIRRWKRQFARSTKLRFLHHMIPRLSMASRVFCTASQVKIATAFKYQSRYHQRLKLGRTICTSAPTTTSTLLPPILAPRTFSKSSSNQRYSTMASATTFFDFKPKDSTFIPTPPAIGALHALQSAGNTGLTSRCA